MSAFKYRRKLNISIPKYYLIILFFFRLPSVFLFLCHIVLGAYIVARKFKKVNPAVSYSVFRIICTLAFPFLASCFLSYLFTYFIIQKYVETQDKIKKAIIAAVIPGLALPLTAITKYILLRKSSEIISSDRAWVLCYFLRGGSITLYRIMQSGFNDIWLFVTLCLLNGLSNILSKATLHFRIKIWNIIVTSFNKIWCGPSLEVHPLDSPRIRRLNADLEIQNILFEYSTTILIQVYLAYYLMVSYEVPFWQAINDSLIRIAISLGIDLASNIPTVFIQIHFYDIPVQRVWQNYWRRHVTACTFAIFLLISAYTTSLFHVFSETNNTFKEDYRLRNCTSFAF